MPSINLEFLNALQTDYRTYPNFTETGTYMGETIMALEPHFSNLHTIEIKKELYEHVKNTYKGEKINHYLGDSGDVLTEILPSITGKSILFLDGHWSAGNTGKGKKDCPLYEELTSIILHHKEEAVIIIDDVRLFGRGPNKGGEICNWEEINVERILNLVKERITTHYFLSSNRHKQDRLLLHVSKSASEMRNT